MIGKISMGTKPFVWVYPNILIMWVKQCKLEQLRMTQDYD